MLTELGANYFKAKMAFAQANASVPGVNAVVSKGAELDEVFTDVGLNFLGL